VTLPEEKTANYVAIADLDGDGRLDLAVTHAFGRKADGQDGVCVHLNLGRGSWDAARCFPSGFLPSHVAASDVDKDGRPDLVLANGVPSGSRTGGVTVLINQTR
jgi:hypothetical protein